MELIAVQGCVVSLDPPSTTPPLTVITIQTAPSNKVFIDGKGCYAGPLEISLAGYTGGAIDVPASGGGSVILNATATKTTIDGKPVIRRGDSATTIINGEKQTLSGPVAVTQVVTFKIKDALQISVTAD